MERNFGVGAKVKAFRGQRRSSRLQLELGIQLKGVVPTCLYFE